MLESVCKEVNSWDETVRISPPKPSFARVAVVWFSAALAAFLWAYLIVNLFSLKTSVPTKPSAAVHSFFSATPQVPVVETGRSQAYMRKLLESHPRFDHSAETLQRAQNLDRYSF